MGSTAQWRGQKKETVNWKIEQQKLFSLNSREIEKKNNRASGTCEAIVGDLNFVS